LPRLLASAERMGLADRIAVIREGETQIFRGASGAPSAGKYGVGSVRSWP